MFKKLGLLAIVAVAGMLIMQSCTKTTEKTITGPTVYDTTQTVVHDTVTIHDTLKVTIHDTTQTVVHDTVTIHDTLKVTIHDTLKVTVHDTVTVNTVSVGAAYIAMQEANVAANTGYMFEFVAFSSLGDEATALGANPSDFGYAKTAANTWTIATIAYVWNGGSGDSYFAITNVVKYLGGNPDLASSWQVTDPTSGVARHAVKAAKVSIN